MAGTSPSLCVGPFGELLQDGDSARKAGLYPLPLTCAPVLCQYRTVEITL